MYSNDLCVFIYLLAKYLMKQQMGNAQSNCWKSMQNFWSQMTTTQNWLCQSTLQTLSINLV